MALSSSTTGGTTPPDKVTHQAGKALPLWISVVSFVGLIGLYLGQRVVVKWEGAAGALSALGVLLVVLATACRFVPMLRGLPAHASAARLLAALQVLGLLSVGIYLLGTDTGAEWVGLAGESHAHLRTVLHVLWVLGLVVSNLSLIFAEFALHPMRGAAHLENPRVWAAALSGATLGLAAGYGSLLVYAAAQEEVQADFSYFKTSQPGEATVKLVQKASKPVRVTAFFPEVSQVRKEVAGYLNQLAKLTGNVEVKLADRYLDPALATELKVVADGVVVITQDDSSQMLTLGTDLPKARSKLMKFDSEFYAKLGKLLHSRHTAYFTTGHGELNEPAQGAEKQEGRSATVAKLLLEQQNYRVKDLGLSEGLGSKVPDDADVVLVLGPTLPFAPEEVATLKRYAESGGKVLMALDADVVATRGVVSSAAKSPGKSMAAGAPAPSTTAGTAGSGATGSEPPSAIAETSGARTAASTAPAPNTINSEQVSHGKQWLLDLATAVGATLVPTVLADEQNYVVRRNDASDRWILPTNRFSSHASVSTLSRAGARAGVLVVGAAHLLETEQAGVKPQVALRSMPSAFNDDDRDYKLSATEERKAYNLAVAISHPVGSPRPKSAGPDENEPQQLGAAEQAEPDAEANTVKDGDKPAQANPADLEMRAFVLSDADVLSDLVMERVAGNQMLLVDALRWLVGEESLAGELESEEDVRIEHTKQQDLAWFYTTIFGVPALVLAGGFGFSRRARGRVPAKKPTAAPPGAQA
jgi:hypothetical protein